VTWDPKRLRNAEEARAYVAGCVSTMLEADFANGSAWLHMRPDDEDGNAGAEGNLADGASERLAHQAARALIALLDKRARKQPRRPRK
jgi:hypothetical protein